MNNNIKLFKTHTFYVIGMAIFICMSLNLSAQNMRPDKSFGIGFQAGNPTGLALQFYRANSVSTDILLAYDLNDLFFLNIHGLWNTHLDQEQRFHLFYGPGGFVGIRNNGSKDNTDNEVEAGISGNFGLNFVVSRLEFFGQLTPRLALTPGTNFNLGGGVGIRFYI
jgi:hypothetical protein